MTTGVRFRGINDTGPRHEKFTYWDSLFDVGLRVRWENLAIISRRGTGKLGFRYSRNEGRICPSAKPASLDCGKHFWIRTQPQHLIRSLNFNAHNTKAARQQSLCHPA